MQFFSYFFAQILQLHWLHLVHFLMFIISMYNKGRNKNHYNYLEQKKNIYFFVLSKLGCYANNL